MISYSIDLEKSKSQWWLRIDNHIIRIDQITEVIWKNGNLDIITFNEANTTKTKDISKEEFEKIYSILRGQVA